MKPSSARLAIVATSIVITALLVLLALELHASQHNARQEIKTQVRDRATLSVALLDSLFQTTTAQIPQDTQLYGGPTVTTAVLDAQTKTGQSIYLAVLRSDGSLVAASSGVTSSDLAEIRQSSALTLVHSGHIYGLGDLAPRGSVGVLDFAVPFPAVDGQRILVTGFGPDVLRSFLTADLKTIPGPRGSASYLVDGHDAVLGSTAASVTTGKALAAPGLAAAVAHGSSDTHGRYLQTAALANSDWHVVLDSPSGPLFNTVTGLRVAAPWILFAGFTFMALLALALALRVARASESLSEANEQLAVLNDDLVNTNAALERRAAELARSNEELDRFASIASHDLQEPLRKVRTFTEQLAVIEADRLTDKGRDYIVRANASAERMQRLIEDLLKFSRVSTQGRPFEAVDLDRLLREVLVDLEAQVSSAGATIDTDRLPIIQADPLQMQQLLQNLVSNALKFRDPARPLRVEVRAERVGDAVRITVRDNGIGFDPRYAMRIFRIFERLHGRNDYPGTGIGLALCRKIADRHGGTIEAQSEPGGGATFTVTLPAGQPDAIDVREEVPVAG